jgi:hypothetical protein
MAQASALDTPQSPQIERTITETNCNEDPLQYRTTEDEPNVLPSDESAQEIRHEESPVYFCEKNETTDCIYELRRILNQATALGISAGPLSSICELLESTDEDSYTDEFRATVTNISMQVRELLERGLESASAFYTAPQLSPNDSFEEYDSGTFTESDVDSIFDHGHGSESETDLDTEALSSCTDNEEADRVLDRELGCCEYWLPPGAQDVERDDLSSNVDQTSVATDPLDDQEPDLTLSSSSFCEDLEVGSECDRTIFKLSNPSDVKLTEFASALVPDTDFGANSKSEALVSQRADDESPPFIPCASYIDFFVPELFDIQPTLPVRESTDLSAPEDDPHSYQSSASISSSQSTQAEIKAEYLQSIVVWIMWYWRLVWQGFWMLKTALRVLVHEGFASEIVNSVVIDSCEFTDNPCEFADDCIDGFAEPVPPDKILHSHLDSFLRSENLSIKDIVQDTQRSSPFPQVQATELDDPLNIADSDLIQSHRQDFQHDKCKPFISFEPITEHPSNYEPFKRAEHQSFFPCASYVDYFVPQLFEPSSEPVSSPNRVFEQIVPAGCPEPDDDPPSYQESVILAESSFVSSNHRKKAEYPPLIFTHPIARLKSFFRDILGVPGVFAIARSQLNPTRVREPTDNRYAAERTIREHPAVLQTSRRESVHLRKATAAEIPEKAVPPDKNFIC